MFYSQKLKKIFILRFFFLTFERNFSRLINEVLYVMNFKLSTYFSLLFPLYGNLKHFFKSRKLYTKKLNYLRFFKLYFKLFLRSKQIFTAFNRTHNDLLNELSCFSENNRKQIEKMLATLSEEKSFLENTKKLLENQHKELIERELNLKKYEILLEVKKADLKKQEKEFEKTKNEILLKESTYTELEKSLLLKEREIKEKEASVNLFLLEKEEFTKEKEKFLTEIETYLKEQKELKNKLTEKIREYEKKLAKLESIESTLESCKKDFSEEGKKAKIVVQETIRQMQKIAKTLLTQSEKLEEKYCNGSFRGFALPLDEIENKIESLKNHLEEINSYSEKNPDIPLSLFIKEIEERLIKANQFKEEWDFPMCFQSAIEGISICFSLEIFLKSLNEWQSHFDEVKDEVYEEETNYYTELGVSENASFEEIKKAYWDLVKKFHPDKQSSDISEEEKQANMEKFFKIQKAYEILSDELKRKEYDEGRRKK